MHINAGFLSLGKVATREMAAQRLAGKLHALKDNLY